MFPTGTEKCFAKSHPFRTGEKAAMLYYWKRTLGGILLLMLPARTTLSSAEGDPVRFGTWVVAWDTASPTDPAWECFDEVNPFAYALSPAFRPVETEPGFMEKAAELRRPGLVFAPVIVNDVVAAGEMKELKSADALAELLSDGVWENHIEELVALARPFDGLEVDYERIPVSLRARYVEFIEKLGIRLHSEGKKLFIDLEPVFVRESGAQRLVERLARSVDGIKIMAYYEKTGVAVRPAAGNSLSWVVDTARRALERIPSEKLVIALSLAATDWTAQGIAWRARRVHFGKVEGLLSLREGELERDEESSMSFFRYRRDGETHEVWFEDAESLRRKVEALRKAGVRNVAFWYWGSRTPDLNSVGLCQN
jgi:spore germination protein YaaH